MKTSNFEMSILNNPFSFCLKFSISIHLLQLIVISMKASLRFFQVGTNFRMSIAWLGGRTVWVGVSWVKHTPQYTNYPQKVATESLSYSTALNRSLAIVGINFRSTVSNWCPPLLVPMTHS